MQAHKADSDYINIGLIVLSMLLAFALPFELLLFSYAVLGPLHYLTEIAWLRERRYFTQGPRDYGWLLALGIVVTGSFFAFDIAKLFFSSDDKGNLLVNGATWQTIRFFYGLTPTVTFVAFCGALLMVFVTRPALKVTGIVVFACIGLVAASSSVSYVYYLVFSVFLTTLVHVFIFTAGFMFYGALRTKSVAGYISVFTLLACGASFFLISPNISGYQISAYTKDTYDATFFYLNYEIFKLFLPGHLTVNEIYFSESGLAIARFIAFAYTFHYLNWFAKTSSIGWYRVATRHWLVIGSLWLSSIALYAYDYRLGAGALYFLSMLHVYLEFPLNWRCVKGIHQELGNRLRRTAHEPVV